MRVMFYIADRGNRFDYIVNLFTGMYGYSHCELFFSDGMSFSSSPRDGGVRFKSIVYDDKWVQYDIIGMSRQTEFEIRQSCDKYIGKKYDWIGIFFTFMLPLSIQDNKKWWCSELCSKLIGIKNYRISPNKLAKILDLPKQNNDVYLEPELALGLT